MGILVEGAWVVDDAKYRNAASGEFVRPDSTFRDWITPDGSGRFAPEAGRYHLLVAANCPWAHRTVIARRLKGLEQIIDVSFASGPNSEHGWPFEDGVDGGPQPADGELRLHQVYTAADPGFTGRVTVPTLWDRRHRTIVNNESADLVRIFDRSFGALSNQVVDLRPGRLEPTIDALNEWIYADINNGVYRCGFATTQAAYEAACRRLFAALDRAEGLLGGQRYLAGDVLTEADVRLFPTLVRFDAVYHGLFKCNLRRLADYPSLTDYVGRLWPVAGFGDTCDIEAFKRGYYLGIRRLNPSGIVPLGPEVGPRQTAGG